MERAGWHARADFKDGKLVRDGDTPQTVLVKFYRWNKWVRGSPLAARPVRLLTRDDARGHVDRMKAAGASLGTVRDVLGVLKLVANKAVDEKPECKGLANPFVRIALQTEEERATTEKARAEHEAEYGASLVVLSPEEAAQGLAKMKNLRLRAMVAVHLLAGLRTGERNELSVEQIDFERGVIVVDRAVRTNARQRNYVGLPKRNKIRIAALCPTLAQILKTYVETLPEGTTLSRTGRKRAACAPRSVPKYCVDKSEDVRYPVNAVVWGGEQVWPWR